MLTLNAEITQDRADEEKVGYTAMVTKCWKHPTHLLEMKQLPSSATDIMSILQYSLAQEKEPDLDDLGYTERLSVRKIFKDSPCSKSPLQFIHRVHTRYLTPQKLSDEFQKKGILPITEMDNPDTQTKKRLEAWMVVISLSSLTGSATFRDTLVDKWNTYVKKFPENQQQTLFINQEKYLQAKELLVALEQSSPQPSPKKTIPREDFLAELEERNIPGSKNLSTYITTIERAGESHKTTIERTKSAVSTLIEKLRK